MALIQVNYLSRSLMRTVPLHVILPVDKISFETMDYANRKDQKFKTLYLLHGIFGNYTDWVSGTRIQRWAEEKNLAVVMPSGDNAFYINTNMPTFDYEQFIAKELVDVTRRMFPLSDKREDTFIAGLSMGGYGALINGMKYPETFSRIAALSSACNILDSPDSLLGINALFGDYEKAKASMNNPDVAMKELANKVKQGTPAPEFFVACGLQDSLFNANRNLRDKLEQLNFYVTYLEEDGGHEWDFWDRNIKRVLEWLPLEANSKTLNSGSVTQE